MVRLTPAQTLRMERMGEALWPTVGRERAQHGGAGADMSRKINYPLTEADLDVSVLLVYSLPGGSAADRRRAVSL
jgi:hypothetical protein